MDRHDLGLIQELAEDLRRTSVSLHLSSRCPTATMGSRRRANVVACLRIGCRMTATDDLRLLLRVVRPLARNFVSYAVELAISAILTVS